MCKSCNGLWVKAGVFIALLAALYVAQHPMDFRVYYFGARGVFDGTRPVYGRESGLGWPMHYRYPPLFLLLFAPFAWLRLGFAAGLWVVLKIAVLVWLLPQIVGKFGDRSVITQLTSKAVHVNWVITDLSPNFLPF